MFGHQLRFFGVSRFGCHRIGMVPIWFGQECIGQAPVSRRRRMFKGRFSTGCSKVRSHRLGAGFDYFRGDRSQSWQLDIPQMVVQLQPSGMMIRPQGRRSGRPPEQMGIKV